MALSKILPASQEQYAGARNLIINGAMQVWQRTTSVTTSSSGTFSTDRWASNAGASTVFSRSTDVPTGFQYSLSVAGATYTGIRTRIEAADCKHIAGQEVTFSWYAKRTAGTGDMKTYLGYASAEDNFGTVTLIEEVVNTASASVSSDWARYTYTITLPANAANGLHFVVFNGSASGAVTTLYTGVQLEVGSTATPFEHRSYADTIRQCRRYFSRYTAASTAAAFLNITVWSLTTKYGKLEFPVEMRTTPTFSVSSNSHFTMLVAGNTTTPTLFTLNAGDGNYAELNVGTANFASAGQSGWIRIGNTSGYADLDAEL